MNVTNVQSLKKIYSREHFLEIFILIGCDRLHIRLVHLLNIYINILVNIFFFFFWCLMALSAISWGPVLVTEEFLQLTNPATHPHIGDSLV